MRIHVCVEMHDRVCRGCMRVRVCTCVCVCGVCRSARVCVYVHVCACALACNDVNVCAFECEGESV